MHQDLPHEWAAHLPTAGRISLWLLGDVFLALIPVVFARWLRRGIDGEVSAGRRLRWWLWAPLALLWLLFLPNTAYLLTEWRHYLTTIIVNQSTYYPVVRGRAYAVDATRNLLFLTAFFGLFSGIGMVTMVAAIRPIEALLSRYAAKVRVWAIPALFVFCSVGVYLGLVDRLNSWEPLDARTVTLVATSPAHIAGSPWLMVIILWFAAFLWLFYRFVTRRAAVDPTALPASQAVDELSQRV